MPHAVKLMRLTQATRQHIYDKWFLAGFGYRQYIPVSSRVTIELKVISWTGKTQVALVETMASGREIIRYQFGAHIAAQAIYRLSHLHTRTWQLDATYNGIAEDNASDTTI